MLIVLRRRYAAAAAVFEGRIYGDFVAEGALHRRKALAHYAYNLVFAVLAAFLIVEPGPRSTTVPQLHTGDIADTDVVSPLTVDIQPKETAAPEREELAKRVAPVFDYDDAILDGWLQNWKETYNKIRQEFYVSRIPKDSEAAALEALGQRIHEYTGQSLPPRDIYFLHQNRFGAQLEQTFVKAAEPLLGRLIAPSDLFPSYYSTGIVVRQINQGLNETLIHDVSRIWSVDHAREFLRHLPVQPAKKGPRGMDDARRMVDILSSLVIPNLKFNPTATQKRIQAAVGGGRQPIQSLKKGQTVVHRGERLSEQQAQLLSKLLELMAPTSRLERFGLAFAILFIFMSVLFRMEITKHPFWRLSLKDSLFFMGLALLNILCVKLALPYLRLFFAPFGVSAGVEYLLPISAGGIIIHLMMGKEAAYSFALVMSVGIGMLVERSFFFAIWSFAVAGAAIQSIRSCKQRTDLYKCGVWSGTIGALLVLSYLTTESLGFQRIEVAPLLITVGLAFLQGLLAAVLTSSFIPILEALFGYTTSLKLLELSNFNHPLLHSLMMKAPGTYHHSVIVGSLAEIAADAIKANSLLARVSAYYHDIGKMTKPLYFIENQAPNSNPHDHLKPTMSAKILFSHVKNGVRLGREYNLGNKIIDVIEQHHGTTLASYFFTKAKKSENSQMDQVSEADFRYPGPRPQTREAAIVMISDACEAATRSIADPTPAKIQTMVHSIVNKRLLEQQFNECDITLTELEIIEENITRTLVSLYHHRIEYPGNPKHEGPRPAGGGVAGTPTVFPLPGGLGAKRAPG
jgi:putative nucleotidyltransferase with HDIG domain